MMKLSALCLPFLLIPFLGCSQSTDPEEDPPPPQDNFELIAEVDIGPEGGVLEAEGIEVVIPAGALDDIHSLELYVNDVGELPYGDKGVTPLYKIEGLPHEGFAELQVSVEYQGELSGQSGIASGRYDYRDDTEDEELVQHFLIEDAEVTSGRLEANVFWEGSGDLGRSIDSIRAYFFFRGLSTYLTERIGNFEYRYDDDYPSQVALLSLLLDSELAVLIENWELDYNGAEFNWPVRVQVFEPRDYDFLGYSSQGWGTQARVVFFIPTPYIDPIISDVLPRSSGPLILHLHQEICETFDWQDGWDESPDQALHQAFLQYSQEVFDIDPTWDRPGRLAGREVRPLQGILAPLVGNSSETYARVHGWSLSPLAKFLMDDPRFGIEGYRNTYAEVRTGTTMMDALVANVSAPISTWLPEFFIAYFQGEIYGVDYNLLIQDPIDEWSPSIDDDEFLLNDGNPISFPDLSAKVIPIHLEDEYEENASLRFSVTSDEVNDENLSVILFAVESDSLIYLGHGTEWILSHLEEDLVSQGVSELIAVVVNASHALNYMGSSELYVTMELDETVSYDTVDINLNLRAWLNVGGEDIPHPEYLIDFLHAEGNITAPYFDATIDYTIGSGSQYSHIGGSVRGWISDDFSVLDSLFAERIAHSYNSGNLVATRITNVKIYGPLEPLDGYPNHFAVDGTTACTYIDFVSMIYNHYGAVDYISAWSCTGDSWLSIQFFED